MTPSTSEKVEFVHLGISFLFDILQNGLLFSQVIQPKKVSQKSRKKLSQKSQQYLPKSIPKKPKQRLENTQIRPKIVIKKAKKCPKNLNNCPKKPKIT